MAILAFAPPMENSGHGRDFSAWLGLVPRQHPTGGKPRLGRIPKMGQKDLRLLLFTGAMAVVRHAVQGGEIADLWLAGMLVQAEESGRGGARRQDGAEGLGGGHEEGGLDPISRTPYGARGRTKRPDIRQYLTRMPPTQFAIRPCHLGASTTYGYYRARDAGACGAASVRKGRRGLRRGISRRAADGGAGGAGARTTWRACATTPG